MTFITALAPDPITCAPPRARRSHGRNHEPHWSTHKSFAEDIDYTSLTFSARSTRPRQMVTFGSKRSSFSFLSVKTCSTQSGESPGEFFLAQELEVDPFKVTYNMHGIVAEWRDGDHVVKKYGPDAIHADVTGLVSCVEVKASERYFHAPLERSLYAAAEVGFSRAKIFFDRITEDRMRETARRAFNITRAFNDRLSKFTPLQLDLARSAVAEGDIPLGRLGELLDIHPSSRLSVVNALMARRVVAYDLDARVNKDMAITVPPPVTARADITTIDI